MLTLFSILSINLSYSLTTVQKASDLEKNYEKLDVKAVADLFMKGGEPTELVKNNLVDYVPTQKTSKATIITAGQGPNSLEQTVPPSIYPFVVARKFATNLAYPIRQSTSDSLKDQFDAIEDRNGNEFFALYDGNVCVPLLEHDYRH